MLRGVVGSVRHRFVDNVGYEVTTIPVEYTVWVLNSETRANAFNLEHSADHVTYTQFGADFSPPCPDKNGFTRPNSSRW